MGLGLATLLVGRAGGASAKVHGVLLDNAHPAVGAASRHRGRRAVGGHAAVGVVLGLAASGLGQVLAVLLDGDLLLRRDAGLAAHVLGGAVVDVAASLAGSATASLAGHLRQLVLLLLGGALVRRGLVAGVRLGRVVGAGVGVLDAVHHPAASLLGLAALLHAHGRPEDVPDVGLGVHGVFQAIGGAATHGLAGAATRLAALLVVVLVVAAQGVQAHRDQATHRTTQDTTNGFLSPATFLHTADVLLALAALIRFLLVAVDEAVGSDGAATGLAGLAARVGLHLLASNLAAALEALLGDRAHARLHVRVEGRGGGEVGAVNLLVLLTGEALGLAPHGLAGLFCHLIHDFSPRRLRASPLLPEWIAWATSSLPGY